MNLVAVTEQYSLERDCFPSIFSYIIPWDSEAFQHGWNILEHPQLQGGVAYPPDHGAGLVWSQSVSQQDPGQQHRPVMRDVTKCQQQLIHLLEETEEILFQK